MFSPESKTEQARVQRPRDLAQGARRRIFWRIWLLVLGVIVVMAAAMAWFWQSDLESERRMRPGREILVKDENGQVIGQARRHVTSSSDDGPRSVVFEVRTNDGKTLVIELPRFRRPAPTPEVSGSSGLNDRDPSPEPWLGIHWALITAMTLVLVTLAAYPLVRRLTRRLESLQLGVQQWSEGNLSYRMSIQGHDEVADLAKRFNHAADRIENLVQSHKHLLAHASHELRSPLARIRMSLELKPLEPHEDPAVVQPWRDEIIRNLNELDALVEEILLASRLDPAVGGPIQLHVQDIDFLGLVAEESARVQAQLHATGKVTWRGDHKLLRRLVRNLLENARRHGRSDQATSAQIDVEVAAIGPNAGYLRVSDRGPGVDANLREKIFEPFFRGPGGSEQQGGVGLGLALAKTIAQQHGAQLTCLPREGGGSVFELRWPAPSGDGQQSPG